MAARKNRPQGIPAANPILAFVERPPEDFEELEAGSDEGEGEDEILLGRKPEGLESDSVGVAASVEPPPETTCPPVEEIRADEESGARLLVGTTSVEVVTTAG